MGKPKENRLFKLAVKGKTGRTLLLANNIHGKDLNDAIKNMVYKFSKFRLLKSWKGIDVDKGTFRGLKIYDIMRK